MATNPFIVADKFLHKGVPCVFLGYPQHQKGYKLYNLLTHTSFITIDVTFYEHLFPYSTKSLHQFLHPLLVSLPTYTCSDDLFLSTTNPEPFIPSSFDSNSSPVITSPSDSIPSSISTPLSTPITPPSLNTLPTVHSSPVLRKSSRPTVPPVWHKDYVIPKSTKSTLSHTPMANQVSFTPVCSTFDTYLKALLAHHDPVHFKQAILDYKWCNAMTEELKALELNGTWDMVDLPHGKKPIGCHWIYKTKLRADGTVERQKASLWLMVIDKDRGLTMLNILPQLPRW